MTHKEIVEKIVGRIDPVGATHIDGERFENLKIMCALVNDLVTEIDAIAYLHKDSYEHSRKQCGQYAKDFLTKTLGIAE
jgi:hypothetical protein